MKSRIPFIIIIIISFFFLIKGGIKSGIFYGDALGYHSYLPSTLIYGNLGHIQDMASDSTIDLGIRNGINAWQSSYPTNDEGNVIIQYTYGIALMNLPFFLLSHEAAWVFNEPMNGFSWPYALGIKFSGIFYGILALFLLYKVLVQYYSKEAVIIALTAISIGTNYLWFFVIQAGMAHIHAFFLYSSIIFTSYKIYKERNFIWIVLCAFSLGLLTLIRPTDIISIVIPLTFGMTTIQKRCDEIKSRITQLIKYGFPAFILPIIPQFLYWKKMTGKFLFYSYDEQGFDWLSPHIFEGLFGANNGWLTYTPLMILPVIGLWKKKWGGPLYWSNLTLIPIYIYIVYAWWCFNYINGFGSRPMIHMYPLLAFPLTGMIMYSKGVIRKILLSLLLVLGLVNLNYTNKMLKGTLFTDLSNHSFNFSTFFSSNISYKDLILRDTNIPQPEIKNKQILNSAPIIDSILIGSKSEYSPFTISHTLTENDVKNDFLMLDGEFLFPALVFDVYHHHMMVLSVDRDGKNIFWKGIKLNNKVGKMDSDKNVEILECIIDEWGRVEFVVPMEKFLPKDKIRAMIWNPDFKEMYVRSFNLSVANN